MIEEEKVNQAVLVLSAIGEPTEQEKSPAGLSSEQIETTILHLVHGLEMFDSLLGLLENYRDGDKAQAELLSKLIVERIGWSLEILQGLKPVN